MSQPILVGLDLGSSRIRLAIGQVSESEERGLILNVIGGVEVPSQGISKGVVSALEDAVASVSAGLERAEQQVGVPIDEAVVGISGTHVAVMDAKGVIGVSRPDGDIREEDIERVMESAKSAANPANYEILHVLPHGFTVDGQAGIKDPLGMHGIRIEADAHLVLGLAGNVRNMTKCVFRTGLDIAALVFGPLAAAGSVTNTRERELGVCVVNVGASTTSVVVFEEGELLHAKVLPIGSDHITSDIAIGLRTSLDAAEQLKILHGSAIPGDFVKRDQVDLSTFGIPESEEVSLLLVSEIIEARVEEICEKVEEVLQGIDRSGMLPAGVVITGGGGRLRGVTDVAKRALRLPASVGAATHLSTPIPEIVHDPAFSTAVGLVEWGFAEIRGEAKGGQGMRNRSRGGKAFGAMQVQLKKIFKSFIP